MFLAECLFGGRRTWWQPGRRLPETLFIYLVYFFQKTARATAGLSGRGVRFTGFVSDFGAHLVTEGPVDDPSGHATTVLIEVLRAERETMIQERDEYAERLRKARGRLDGLLGAVGRNEAEVTA